MSFRLPNIIGISISAISFDFWSISCCGKVRGFLSSSAGAIYVWKDFTQSSGTLTISNASAETGGVVDFGCCLRWLQVVLVPRFHASCLMDSQRLHRCMSKLVFKFLSVPKSLTCFQSQRVLINLIVWKFGAVTKELCISAAGAIYVYQGSFTQSGGTLTITDASSESDGGVVRTAG